MTDLLNIEAFRAILDSVEEGIHVVDSAGITILYNQAAARMEGLHAAEVINRHVLEVFPSLTESTSTLLNVMKSGKPILNQQQTYTSFKGRKVTAVNSTLPIIVGGKVAGAVEVSRDITNVKKLSEKIVDLQAELLGKKVGAARDDRPGSGLFTLADFVSEDSRVVDLKALAARAARTNSSVLVFGETGTGKEILVQAIHSASLRSGGPFVAQNCAAVPETLLEGLLFGTARGGFTGAKDRPGLFELAHGGTLYLDEINSMPIGLQAKLLRAIQDRTVRRIGETGIRRIDVRIMASTSVDPAEAIHRRELRSDLYYRLNVVFLTIPPLRDRKGDIPLLVSHFIRKFNSSMGLSVEGVSRAAMEALRSYLWPGNVRELEHAIEGAMNVVDGTTVELSHLPVSLRGPARGAARAAQGAGAFGLAAEPSIPVPLRETLGEQERNIIHAAMEASGWNVSRAARLLGIPRQTLQYRLRNLGLPKFRRSPGSGHDEGRDERRDDGPTPR
ncbi:MAG: sigma 54-interacting transcriptional regulator [Firmicutes bacterium]|nr:sigma 54-interacting transcriptional regulator [Bacillota bacterium]